MIGTRPLILLGDMHVARKHQHEAERHEICYLAVSVHGDKAMLLPANANASNILAVYLGQCRIYGCKSALNVEET